MIFDAIEHDEANGVASSLSLNRLQRNFRLNRLSFAHKGNVDAVSDFVALQYEK